MKLQADGLCKSNLVNWTPNWAREIPHVGPAAKDSLQLHMALSLLHNLLLVRSSDCCFGESLKILEGIGGCFYDFFQGLKYQYFADLA